MAVQTITITMTIIVALILLPLNFYPVINLNATSSVKITTDENEDDGSAHQGQQPIQPTATLQQEEEDNDINDNSYTDNYDNYDVVIPDGAAWKETVSERYYPSELTAPAGSDVTWINDDDLPHTVTSGNKAAYGSSGYIQDGKFNSENLEHGDSFSFHFAEPGRYEYYCISHPWMSGVVTVE